jgi:hypothetical protein
MSLEVTQFQVILRKGKQIKTIPVEASTGSEGSRKLRLPHFKIIGVQM